VASGRRRVVSGPFSARFWFSALCLAVMPNSIGYQDIAALVVPPAAASPDWHLIASPFGTIETATFRYTRPIGSAIPELQFQNVNFDPRSLDAQAWKIDEPLTPHQARQIEYPSVNRSKKGDRLPAANAPAASVPANLPQLQPVTAPTPAVAVPPAPAEQHTDAGSAGQAAAPPAVQMEAPQAAVPAAATFDAPKEASAVASPASPAAADDDLVVADRPPELPAADEDGSSTLDEMSFLDDDAGDRSAQVYFGTGVMGAPSGLQSWAPGAAPILASPSEDSGIKLSALEGGNYGSAEGGETIAGKDDVSRLQTPAQRLGLLGKPRARAEKCIADAVYFEARGEPLKGQQAVAQVVINRVFSGFYPHDVCGVVYQNADRHLACQFTFACEGKDLSRIDEPDMWEQAKRIAKDALDGKIWLADIGHATHYHAYWVHPSWVHEMVRLYKFGVHTFYRPRNWGDGEDDWGPTELQAETMRPDPEALKESPVPAPKHPDVEKSADAARARSG